MGSENFDFSTALDLLPVMNDDDECVTRNLIDGIDFYNEMLCESARKVLINFVLKTRLSGKGKFYLKSEYRNVQDLITDMKKHLLPRKSHTSLQIQMLNCKQGYKTIKEFGEEIEKILVDLTYAQLDFLQDSHSQDESRSILFLINEKTSIKCFCDGLSSNQLRLIMACKQFKSLIEAIQVAIEEEIMLKNLKTDRHDRLYFNKNMQFYNIQKQTECRNKSTKLQIQQVQRNQTPELPSMNDITHSLVPMYRNDFRINKVMKFNTDKSVDSKNECLKVCGMKENKNKHEDEYETSEWNLGDLFREDEYYTNDFNEKCDININEILCNDKCDLLEELSKENMSKTNGIEEKYERIDRSVYRLCRKNYSNVDCED